MNQMSSMVQTLKNDKVLQQSQHIEKLQKETISFQEQLKKQQEKLLNDVKIENTKNNENNF